MCARTGYAACRSDRPRPADRRRIHKQGFANEVGARPAAYSPLGSFEDEHAVEPVDDVQVGAGDSEAGRRPEQRAGALVGRVLQADEAPVLSGRAEDLDGVEKAVADVDVARRVDGHVLRSRQRAAGVAEVAILSQERPVRRQLYHASVEHVDHIDVAGPVEREAGGSVEPLLAAGAPSAACGPHQPAVAVVTLDPVVRSI